MDCPNPLYDLSALALIRWYGLHARIQGDGKLMIGPPANVCNDVRAFVAMMRDTIKLELEIEVMP